MASSGLPSGAFLTSINGRRCTAIPRIAATTARTKSATRAATTSSSSRATEGRTTADQTTVGQTTADQTRADRATADRTTADRTTAERTTADRTTAERTTAERTTAERTTADRTTGLAAAPAVDADASTTAAGQIPTSTTSSSLTFTTTTISSSSVRIPADQGSESSPPTSSPTAFPTALLPTSAPAVDTLASSSQPVPSETTSPLLPDGPAATPLLTTIEPPQIPTDPPVAEATTTTSTRPAANFIPTSNNNAVQSTVAVAGGVIGGVVALGILAFFIWWWRRRLLRKRRSTLLTPLDVVPSSFDDDEKGGYVITRGSIGPTPMTEKVSAALGHNFRRIRGYIRNKTAPAVNLDRGTSQFIDAAGTHSRAKSRIIGTELTVKDSLKDWWSRFGGRMKLNSPREHIANKESMVVAQEKRAILGSQPDFLTLVGMDGGEQDRGAQRRQASMSRRNGSASSTDHFLSGLDLDFGSRPDDNPFSDTNAISHTSAKPAPLVVGINNRSPDPFSYANAIRNPPPAMPKPTTYVADIRRSRSNSTAAAAAPRHPSTVYYGSRDSVGSLVSFATATTNNQRNKFRSDPFDLERPELLGDPIPIPPNPTVTFPPSTSRSSSTAATAGSTTEEPQLPPRYPTGARTRAESFTLRYSKYSSGVSTISSMGDWSDPGPDVGPASAATAARWTPPPAVAAPVSFLEGDSVAERGAVSQGVRNGGRRTSGGSLGSVGKAM